MVNYTMLEGIKKCWAGEKNFWHIFFLFMAVVGGIFLIGLANLISVPLIKKILDMYISAIHFPIFLPVVLKILVRSCIKSELKKSTIIMNFLWGTLIVLQSAITTGAILGSLFNLGYYKGIENISPVYAIIIILFALYSPGIKANNK